MSDDDNEERDHLLWLAKRFREDGDVESVPHLVTAAAWYSSWRAAEGYYLDPDEAMAMSSALIAAVSHPELTDRTMFGKAFRLKALREAIPPFADPNHDSARQKMQRYIRKQHNEKLPRGRPKVKGD